MATDQNAAFLEVSASSSVSSDEELEAATEKVFSKVSAAQPAAIARERSLLLNPPERERADVVCHRRSSTRRVCTSA